MSKKGKWRRLLPDGLKTAIEQKSRILAEYQLEIARSNDVYRSVAFRLELTYDTGTALRYLRVVNNPNPRACKIDRKPPTKRTRCDNVNTPEK